MNPTDHPPSAEAVKAAYLYADYQSGSARWRDAIFHLSPHIHEAEQPAAAAARILAAHARAKEAELDKLVEEIDVMNDELSIARGETFKAESEVARLREALEEISGQWKSDEIEEKSGGSNTPEDADFECGYDSCIDTARKALTGEAGA